MIKVKPKFAYDEKGKKIGVLLTIRDFKQIIDELEDLSDYELIKERAGKKEKTFTPEEVLAEIIGRK